MTQGIFWNEASSTKDWHRLQWVVLTDVWKGRVQKKGHIVNMHADDADVVENFHIIIY